MLGMEFRLRAACCARVQEWLREAAGGAHQAIRHRDVRLLWFRAVGRKEEAPWGAFWDAFAPWLESRGAGGAASVESRAAFQAAVVRVGLGDFVTVPQLDAAFPPHVDAVDSFERWADAPADAVRGSERRHNETRASTRVRTAHRNNAAVQRDATRRPRLLFFGCTPCQGPELPGLDWGSNAAPESLSISLERCAACPGAASWLKVPGSSLCELQRH
jgi:hypothetical protein